MSKMTPRDQLEDVLLKYCHTNKRVEYSGLADGEPLPDEVAVDAIIAVFKGLSAMQEEPSPSVYGPGTKNALRRQILAELEHPNDR
jgi:hypothetical protein